MCRHSSGQPHAVKARNAAARTVHAGWLSGNDRAQRRQGAGLLDQRGGAGTVPRGDLPHRHFGRLHKSENLGVSLHQVHNRVPAGLELTIRLLAMWRCGVCTAWARRWCPSHCPTSRSPKPGGNCGRESLLQGHNCHSGQTLRGGSCVLRFTGCGANCLERWLDDDTGRRQRRYQTHSFRDAADRVAVFFAAIRLLGISFLFRGRSGGAYCLWITGCQLVATFKAALFSQFRLKLAPLLH